MPSRSFVERIPTGVCLIVSDLEISARRSRLDLECCVTKSVICVCFEGSSAALLSIPFLYYFLEDEENILLRNI